MKRTIGIAIACCLILPVAASSGAGAHHQLLAEHVPPAVAPADHDLSLHVPVATSCFIAYCGWLDVRVVYRLAGGTAHEVTGSVPYQPAAVVTLTIPAQHVRTISAYPPATPLTYAIEVRQSDCLGDCHGSTVHLPRMGDTYTTLVVPAP